MRLHWSFLLLAFGCGGRAAPVAEPAIRVTPGELDAVALLTPTAARASKGGAGPLALVSRGLLREGDRTGAFVEPQATGQAPRCLFLFARGAPSLADLDLSVFSDDGEPLAQDEEPDATPAVLLCPPYPARMYVSARAASGEGLVALGAQAVPLAAAENVRRAASAKDGMGPANRRLDQWPELENAVQTELGRLGPGARETRRVGLPADRALTTSLSEDVPASSCASLLLLPDPSLFALDVELQDEDGALLLRAARATEAQTTLRFCTDVARKVTASFRPHVGRGLVGAVWFRGPREPALDARVLASHASESPKAWLDGEVKRLAFERESHGAKKLRDEVFSVKPAAVFARPLTALDASACHSVSALVGAPNARVSLSLLTTDGRAIGQRQGGAHAGMVLCGVPSAQAVVGIREAQGAGHLSVHRLPFRLAGAVRVPTAASRAATVLDELGAPVEQSTVLEGSQELAVTEIPRGRCLLAAASGESFGGATLDVTELAGAEAGRQLVRGDGDARWIRLCADQAPRRVKLVAAARPGIAVWALTPLRR